MHPVNSSQQLDVQCGFDCTAVRPAPPPVIRRLQITASVQIFRAKLSVLINGGRTNSSGILSACADILAGSGSGNRQCLQCTLLRRADRRCQRVQFSQRHVLAYLPAHCNTVSGSHTFPPWKYSPGIFPLYGRFCRHRTFPSSQFVGVL